MVMLLLGACAQGSGGNSASNVVTIGYTGPLAVPLQLMEKRHYEDYKWRLKKLMKTADLK